MKVNIFQWEEKKIKDFDVVQKGELLEEEVLYTLQNIYYQYQTLYSIQPFIIVFTNSGYAIRTNQYVGILSNKNITMFIKPVIPELTYEKLLYLESLSKKTFISEQQKIVYQNISNEETVSVIDYFSVSLVTTIYTILSEGMFEDYKTIQTNSNSIKGNINFSKQISRRPDFTMFYLKTNIRSCNNLPNQIILLALQKAIRHSQIQWLKPQLQSLIIAFKDSGVKEIEETDIVESNYANFNDFSSMVRQDYEKALAYSSYIIFGLDLSSGNKAVTLPEHIIDMNQLFENYVIEELLKTYKEGLYKKYVTTLGILPDPPTNERFLELDGYYCYNSIHNVVIDTKNKYRSKDDLGNNSKIPSNQDIYQQYYYATRLNSHHVVLVYPASKFKNSPIGNFEIQRNGHTVNIYSWGLNISGSPHENKKAIKSLAKFINELK